MDNKKESYSPENPEHKRKPNKSIQELIRKSRSLEEISAEAREIVNGIVENQDNAAKEEE